MRGSGTGRGGAEAEEGGEEEEREERERRKTCVIVHGVRESEAQTAQERINEDMGQIRQMFGHIHCEEVGVAKIIRLGSREKKGEENKLEKARPLKLVLSSEEEKRMVLREAKNLREIEEGNWSKVFVHQDRTPKERVRRRVLGEELKRRKEERGEDLVIFRGKILPRRTHREEVEAEQRS